MGLFGLFKKDNNSFLQTALYHLEGLPIAEKVLCTITLMPTELQISGGGTSFAIDLNQIRNAEFKTDRQPAPSGGIWATSYMLINYINLENYLLSVTFKLDIAEGKAKQIKNALKIVDELNLRSQNRPNIKVQL
ncbi:hypothetical protein ACFPVX_13445 [Cohnella faecalis]|uniref:Uncharacterized protein n=1 Tax=Cohnella faecalis TaxID=2315694 RepID=A0A398CK96_9BACL|nr:hypothetical protein [Cohnella faecalis]RIE02572.1 hypothetical protein D3H35_17970 [Cohnella faecalis]